MTFIDLSFLVFLGISMILFYICPVRHRWLVLLGVSIVFYVIAGIKFLPFILLTSLSVFLAGCAIGKRYEAMETKLQEGHYEREETKRIREEAKKTAKKYLLAVLILNVGILCIVKFARFAENPVNMLLQAWGREGNFSAAVLIVPLGISYYTFSCLSYILDVYWKKEKYEKNYARFLLYAIYFPHILQGPIARYSTLGRRLKGELLFDYERICKGLQLMLWGFFKKLVIADRINIFNNAVYADNSGAEGLIYWFAFFLDLVYIYADFSGCMDIARGASQIFGVELDLNFDHPFSSKTIVEFWRRWHISLGNWFKDYVYYPISISGRVINLNKKLRKRFSNTASRNIITAIPVTVTWVLTGLWHGTGATYLAWGLYYAFMMFMSASFGGAFANLTKKLHINTQAWSWNVFQMVRTTCIFGLGRLLTRPGSLRMSAHVIKSALTTWNPWVLTDGTLYKYGLGQKSMEFMAASILVFGGICILQQRISVREKIAEQNLVFRWGLYFAAIFTVLIFGIYGVGYDASAFLYMGY